MHFIKVTLPDGSKQYVKWDEKGEPTLTPKLCNASMGFDFKTARLVARPLVPRNPTWRVTIETWDRVDERDLA